MVNTQQLKPVYAGPFTGIDVSMPETDIAPNATPFAQNVFLRNGEIRSRSPLTFLMQGPQDGTAVRCITCFQDINGVAHTVCITRIAIYQLSSNWQYMVQHGTNPWLVLANFGATQPDIPYSYAILQTNLFFTNAGSGIFQWNGLTNTVQSVGNLADGTVFSGFYLMELNAKLITAYTIESKSGTTNVFPFRVRWTSTAPSFSSGTPWDVTTNLGAGFNDEFDVPDVINGILPLGRVGYIYRSNGISEMIPNGNGNGFDFDHLWASDRGIGSINAQTLSGYGPMHMFMANDEIYKLTPNSFNQVGGRALNAIKQDIAQANGFVLGTIIPYINIDYVYLTYWLVIPFSNNTSKIWIYDIKNDSWTPQLFNNKVFTARPRNVYTL